MISTIRIMGPHSIRIYDEKGKISGCVALNDGDELVGYTSVAITIRKGGRTSRQLYLYDEHGRYISGALG